MAVSRDELLRELRRPSLWQRLSLADWGWAALVALATGGAYGVLREAITGFELTILIGSALTLIGLGWHWPAMRWYSVAVGAASLLAVMRYPELAAAQSDFLLRYLLSSQSAIMWMSALFPAATLAYGLALALNSDFTGRVASALTWTAAGAGLTGLMVRWHETYLHGADIGYIPVSNLYEVFVLFAVMTALIYLYYEAAYRTRAMGVFVLTIISASVAFLLWYHFDRQAYAIEPLVPALQSYWMKIHVPANFVGYGCFAIAAMLGVAYLIRVRAREGGALAERLPTLAQLDDVMYKVIALGFAFFTVATILGALWAAEAWGGYWSWDPKETWALIVWLNYAAWLHLRFTKGLRGTPMAWWAIAGLFVTTFAFLGVNMFLSGLHSYGEL
ncbi:c-type cytochrome biogenesis protein CcsB [Sediminicurvatus halobius]|uniref:C-type cytochrome biogenesis protein CcsB n=1 Tax=Sediminicurvatus halobius TaxID=2182432 RepID=A0A2U2N9J8_9GAMM|nr:c-type cytochrome biogenesis protein CcsB [Spiribacter halobius]PWG65762.1 c-type cytochrome biogenesis protein CcsB [Spiribacter halobius]UEX77800.1 c-type cytochrome biogenesis protein CcsB [Spiribacter halobius]